MEPHSWTIHEARERLDNGRITATGLTRSVLARIEAVEPRVAAFNTVCADMALEQAAAADRRLQAGERGGLLGIPLALKDNMITQGVATTCSSRILKNFVPPADGAMAARFKEQGAINLGKTNLDEFAMGSSTENSATQITRNPWNLERAPGGSSGGAAACVAADMALAALGSDTGGSIRQPAALCGVVGLKPTYGRVSRYGLVAFASSLDQIGPITKDVADAAIVLGAIAGRDPLDATSSARPVPDYSRGLKDGIKGLRIGVPREYFIDGMDAPVADAVRAAIDTLKGLGATVREISLPHTRYAVATYYLVATAEASSNLGRYDGVRYGHRAMDARDLLEMYMATRDQGFGPEVKRRIMLGTYALSAGYYDAYYKKAQQARTLILKDFTDAFGQVDVIATPTSPTGAFRLGERTADPLQMYLSDIFTISINLAGLPGMSQPCGVDGNGMPVGLQLIGKAFDEATMLRAGWAFEQATAFHKAKPSL